MPLLAHACNMYRYMRTLSNSTENARKELESSIFSMATVLADKLTLSKICFGFQMEVIYKWTVCSRRSSYYLPYYKTSPYGFFTSLASLLLLLWFELFSRFFSIKAFSDQKSHYGISRIEFCLLTLLRNIHSP